MRTPLLAAMSLLAGACASTQPVPIEAPGEYVHPGSRLAFPLEAEGFRRMSVVRRDRDGERVTAGYSGGTPHCPAAVTFWIDPFDRPLDAATEAARSEVKAAYPEAVAETTLTGQVAANPAQSTLFDLQGRKLELVVVARPGWYLKYRAMYPANCADDASHRVRNFLGVLPP